MTPEDHARRAAAANDVVFDEFVVIQDTNNVVAWLKPAPIVVKVGRWPHSARGMLREHEVARWLARQEANVAAPIGEPYGTATSPMVSTL